MYNLGTDVQQWCDELKIEIITKVGGPSFPFVSLDTDGPNFTIKSKKTGSGPESLETPITIRFCLNMDWEEFMYIDFPTAKEAIFALSKPDFQKAVHFYHLNICSKEGDQADVERIGFSDTFKSLYYPELMNAYGLCERVIGTFNGKVVSE